MYDCMSCMWCRIKNQLTAADVVNHMTCDGLRDVIKKYGEERHAKLIAHAIVDSRYAFGPITTTAQLANIVAMACNGLELTLIKIWLLLGFVKLILFWCYCLLTEWACIWCHMKLDFATVTVSHEMLEYW